MLMELDIFSGESGYISASRAAEKCGYSSDYIGQLCRAKKIPGKLIGRTWFVDLGHLKEYKKHSQDGKKRKNSPDALADQMPKNNHLVKTPDWSGDASPAKSFKKIVLSYEKDEAPHLPQLKKKVSHVKPSFASQVGKEVAALALALIMASGSLMILEYASPTLATSVAALPLSSVLSTHVGSLVEVLHDLRDLAFDSFEPKKGI